MEGREERSVKDEALNTVGTRAKRAKHAKIEGALCNVIGACLFIYDYCFRTFAQTHSAYPYAFMEAKPTYECTPVYTVYISTHTIPRSLRSVLQGSEL